ncbi:hypothetical protein [Actinomadura litoris]|uniref:hypothetical protein n=1 Tax=Actinomadura litoris TaxID=2678616 RepID=UPI001FA750AE|nr:hypothetical protein [Actinomadura litoris]
MDSNPTTPDEPDFNNLDEAKVWLKRKHPLWNIIRTDRGRWWGLLDPSRGVAIVRLVETTTVEADTAQSLDRLIVEAERPLTSAS